MIDEPQADRPRSTRPLWIAGLVGLCVLALMQVLIAVLLMGRLEQARVELRALEDRLAFVESAGASGEASRTSAGTPSRAGAATEPPQAREDRPRTAPADQPEPRSRPAPATRTDVKSTRETLVALLSGAGNSERSKELKQAAEALAAEVNTPETVDPETALLLARAWDRLKDAGRARLWLERAGEIPPQRAAEQLLLAKVLLATGGNELAAERALTHALKAPETRPKAAKTLAGIHLDRQNLDDAAELLESVTEDHQDTEYRLLRGELAVQRGAYEEAIRHLAPVIEQDEVFPEAHLQMGIAKLRLGQAEPALYHFIEAQRAEPTQATPIFWQGVAQLRLGQGAEAMERFERAIDLDSQYAPPWQYLGIALANTDKLDEAVNRLNQAVRLDPENPEAFFALAVCHARRKAPEPALEALRRAIQLDASFAGKIQSVETFAEVLTAEQLESLKR